jgi:uncharacterized protein (DUF362 family)
MRRQRGRPYHPGKEAIEMTKSKVAILKTAPETVIADYGRLMDLADYSKHVSQSDDLILKLNLSWTKYFPACSSQPWQLEGVVAKLMADGFAAQRVLPVENKTVVTNPLKGAANNLWLPILRQYGLEFKPLPEQEWIVYKFKSKLLKLNHIFPDGIEIPKMYVGKQILHLPTVKTHGHTVTTGAVKNAFGGLLKEVRHYAHKHIHEVLVDLMLMQRELHPSVFAVMDGTVAGDGAGPRTMNPVVTNYILASADSVAIDAVAAKLMGFDPMSIPYIRMCDEMQLGQGDPRNIEVVGADVSSVNFHFKTKKSFVIWGDQMLRRGPLRFLEKVALHSPLVVWAPAASNFYHDILWYPTVGQSKIAKFNSSEWGRLWREYKEGKRAPAGQTVA